MSLIVEQKEAVLYLTFDRPEKYNSVNKETAMAILAALDKAENDSSIRAICITGSGKAFCAGQDLVEAISDNGLSIERIVIEHYNPIIRKIKAIGKPIIAAVNGVAAGAGANIALACDIVIAKESASFIQAFSKIGLIPDSGGTFHLPRLVGYAKALALMMTGDKVPAREAEAMGMIYKCVSDEEYEEAVTKLVNKLSKMPTKALGYTKHLLNESVNQTLEGQLELERKYQLLSSETSDYNEGVASFLEKRKPVFKGE